jgi:hypothetical protein
MRKRRNKRKKQQKGNRDPHVAQRAPRSGILA